jgi:beta-barrel assembly-enhancing protease
MRRPAWAAIAAVLAASHLQAAESIPTGSPAIAGYQPVGTDEQGLWSQMGEAERELKASKFLVQDPDLLAYLRRVLCKEVGQEKCATPRIYLVRDPDFNASMTPNGAMILNTGLLLRVRNEAELAAILGHEFAHFEQRHTLAALKSARSATGWAAFLSAVPLVPLMIVSGFFTFSREQEREADLDALRAMRANGYRTMSAADVWANLRNEMDATAAARKVRSRKDKRSMFDTHPATAERLAYLKSSAAADQGGFTGEAEYRAAISPLWPMLIDDQVKLNDFGGSEYLLAGLAGGGWTAPLLYARAELHRYRGQAGDFDKAASLYREALAKPEAPDAAWRGLGLALARNGDTTGAKAAIDEYLKRNPQASDRPMLAMISGGSQ